MSTTCSVLPFFQKRRRNTNLATEYAVYKLVFDNPLFHKMSMQNFGMATTIDVLNKYCIHCYCWRRHMKREEMKIDLVKYIQCKK